MIRNIHQKISWSKILKIIKAAAPIISNLFCFLSFNNSLSYCFFSYYFYYSYSSLAFSDLECDFNADFTTFFISVNNSFIASFPYAIADL